MTRLLLILLLAAACCGCSGIARTITNVSPPKHGYHRWLLDSTHFRDAHHITTSAYDPYFGEEVAGWDSSGEQLWHEHAYEAERIR